MNHPSPGSKPDSTEIAKRLRAVTDYVRDCERRVALGEIMELDGLDRNVMEICDGITKLPKEQGQLLEKQMATLIDDLEHLADAMRAQQDKMDPEGNT